MRRDLFVTGGTGYLGRPLIAALLTRGHAVHALARERSAPRVPDGARVIVGDALDASTYADRVPNGCTFVHLVGVAHPGPGKAREFEAIDLASVRESVAAARTAGAAHFVYVSVAHPAPVMRAYIAARLAGEALLATSGLPATILRPWYVLGPGHRWPYALLPVYALLERLPATRDAALRLGLVTRAQMIAALVNAAEREPLGTFVMDVTAIRNASMGRNSTYSSGP